MAKKIKLTRSQKIEETKKKQRRSTEEVSALKSKMIQLKIDLPKGAVSKFVAMFPEFSPYKKSTKVRQVFDTTIVDEEIIEKFEILLKEWQGKS